MSRNNEKTILIKLGEIDQALEFKKFDFTPPFCKKIKRVGLVSQTYNEVSKGFEFELSISIDNKKKHLGKFPVKIGKDKPDTVESKFLIFDRNIDCSKNISGFVKALNNGSLRDIDLLIVLER